MGLEVISKKVSLDKALDPFTFSGQVQSFLFGISSYELTYGSSTDHHVQTASIALNASKIGKQVTVNYSVVFKDDSGNSYNSSESNLTVTVAAWIGDSPSRSTDLVNWARSIDNNGSSEPIELPQPPLSAAAVISGFDVSYGDDDHHVERVYTSVGANPSGQNVKLTASVGMYDHSGNNASTANANAGLITTFQNDPGFEIQVHTSGGKISFAKPVKQIGTFVQDFDMSYGNTDHHVRTLEVWNYIGGSWSPGDSSADLYLGAVMNDDSGNSSSSASATSLVIGVYA